jgi:hypothetical protein
MKKISLFLLVFLFCFNFSLAYDCEKYSDGSNRAVGDVDGNKIINGEDVKIIFELFLTEDYLICADINQNGDLNEDDLNLIISNLEGSSRGLFDLEGEDLYSFGELNSSTNLPSSTDISNSSSNVSKTSSSSSSKNIYLIVSSPKEGGIYSINSVLLTARDSNQNADFWKYSLNNGENVSFDISKNNFIQSVEGENFLIVYASNENYEVSKKINFFVNSSSKSESNLDLDEENSILNQNTSEVSEIIFDISSEKFGFTKILFLVIGVFVFFFLIFFLFNFFRKKSSESKI